MCLRKFYTVFSVEKEAVKLADQLEGFNLTKGDDYNFETDFTPK